MILTPIIQGGKSSTWFYGLSEQYHLMSTVITPTAVCKGSKMDHGPLSIGEKLLQKWFSLRGKSFLLVTDQNSLSARVILTQGGTKGFFKNSWKMHILKTLYLYLNFLLHQNKLIFRFHLSTNFLNKSSTVPRPQVPSELTRASSSKRIEDCTCPEAVTHGPTLLPSQMNSDLPA